MDLFSSAISASRASFSISASLLASFSCCSSVGGPEVVGVDAELGIEGRAGLAAIEDGSAKAGGGEGGRKSRWDLSSPKMVDGSSPATLRAIFRRCSLLAACSSSESLEDEDEDEDEEDEDDEEAEAGEERPRTLSILVLTDGAFAADSKGGGAGLSPTKVLRRR